MIALVPNKEYKYGDPFPLIEIPLDLSNSDYWSDFQLEDFQWWAKADDFDKWFKSSGRKWTADESVNVEYPTSNGILENKRIPSFHEFVLENLKGESYVYEDEEEKSDAGESGKSESYNLSREQVIKFWYAYQKLLSDGSISNPYDLSGMSKGSVKAIYLSAPDGAGESKNDFEMAYTLRAIRFKAINDVGAGKLLEYDLAYPGPVDIKDDTLQNVAIKSGNAYEKWGKEALQSMFMAGGIFAAIKIAGGGYMAWLGGKWGVWGTKKFYNVALKTGKNVAAPNFGVFGKLYKGTSSVIKYFMQPMKAVKGIQVFFKGGSAAIKALSEAGKIGTGAVRVLNATKAFFTGGSSALKAAVEAGEATNPIGWILLATDAVFSLVNWYSDNQAPLADEAEEWFGGKSTFSPSMVQIGETITFCWVQDPQSAWGVALSFIASNSTRTILNMTKIIETPGKESIFILQSANSKSLNEQIQNSMLVLIAIPNQTLDQSFFKEGDLDGKIYAIPREHGENIPAIYNFRGVSDWGLLEKAVDNSEGVYFKSDPDAPNRYDWNFEDVDGFKINVSGTLVSDDDLKEITPEKMEKYFLRGTYTKKKEAEGENLEAKSEKGGESEENLSEYSSYVDSFSEFHGINEEESESDPVIFTEPCYVAIYLCESEESKKYAEESLNSERKKPQFTNFAIGKNDYNAKKNDSIEVSVNSDEDIENPKAGKVVIREDESISKKEKEEREKSEIEDEKDKSSKDDSEETEDNVQSSEKIKASDIKKKERKHSTIIRDKEKKSGLSIMDEFVDEEDKKILGIEDWNKITLVKAIYNDAGDITEVRLRNSDAKLGNRGRNYKISDGDSFEIAKKLSQTINSSIDFSKK